MEQEWRRDPAHGIKGQWESQVFRWGGLQQGSGRAQPSHQQRDALTRTLGRRGSTAVAEDERGDCLEASLRLGSRAHKRRHPDVYRE